MVHQKELIQNESDSLISKILDQFYLKDTIIKISYRTPFEVTSEFINIVTLFIFLLTVYYNSGILELKPSLHMIVLGILGFSGFIELIYVNTSLLKKYFGQNANVQRFLNNMHTYTKKQTKDKLNDLYFSSECINYFINSMANEKNVYQPYVIESVILKQHFSKENLDLLFKPDILKYVLPDVIIKFLPKYKNCLTYKHLSVAYNQFKDDDSVIKILFATQSNSLFLLKDNPDDERLSLYHEKYQVNKENMDMRLKIIPLNKFYATLKWLFVLFTISSFFIYIYGEAIAKSIEPIDLVVIIMSSLFVGALLSYGFVGSILRKINKYYHNHYIKKVLE